MLAAAQLNDQNETRESKSIQQDADNLFMIADDGLLCLRDGHSHNGDDCGSHFGRKYVPRGSDDMQLLPFWSVNRRRPTTISGLSALP